MSEDAGALTSRQRFGRSPTGTVCFVPTNQQPFAVGVGLRWARALAVAMTAWCTASAAHLLDGGRLPTLAVMGALIVVTAWPVSLSLGRQASGRRLICLVGAGQVLMHLAFVGLAGWSAQVAAPVESTMPGMGVHHEPAQLLTMTSASSGGAMRMAGAGHAMSILPGPLMVLAHLIAAVLLGCALRSGERVLFSLLGHLAQLVRPALRISHQQVLYVLAALLAGPELAPAAVVKPSWDEAGPRLPEHLLVRAVGWRGPPRALLSFA
jgi:hypothetical protein